MKEKPNNLSILYSDQLYIPHGSDERRLYLTTIMRKVNLYIPHGSDERNEKIDYFIYLIEHFISHMVQMKVSYNPQSIGSPITPLYPTWFR